MKGRWIWAALTGACAALWLAGAGTAAAAVVWLLLLPVLSWGLNLWARRRISVELEMPASGSRESEIPLTVTVANESRIPTGPVLCRLSVTNTLTGETLALRIPVSMAPRGSGSASGQIRPRYCGYLRVRVEGVQVLDWFGLLPLSCAPAGKAGTTILPDLFPVRVHLTVPPVTPEDGLDYAGDRPGWDYSETFQLRDYRAGDSLRAVHWKLTGKTDRFVIRDPSLPVIRSLLVFWDKNAGSPPPEAMNGLGETMASLCQALIGQGVEFHLGWNENQQILVEEIDSTDTLCAAIPRLIHRKDPGELTGGALLGRADRLQYGKILYFGAELPPEMEELAQRGTVTAFLWGDGEMNAPCPVLRVRPQVYSEELQTMELDT